MTQFFIAVAILLGVLEKAFFVAEYAYVDNEGISSECEGRGRERGGRIRESWNFLAVFWHWERGEVEEGNVVLSDMVVVRLFMSSRSSHPLRPPVSGSSTASPFSSYLVIAEGVSALKKTFARVLLIIVSLGYGTVM